MTSFSTYENSHLSYLFLFVFNHFIVLSFVEFQDLFYYWIMNDFMKHFQWPFIHFAIYVCEYMYIYVSVYIYILSKKRNAHVIQQEFFQVWSLYDWDNDIWLKSAICQKSKFVC